MRRPTSWPRAGSHVPGASFAPVRFSRPAAHQPLLGGLSPLGATCWGLRGRVYPKDTGDPGMVVLLDGTGHGVVSNTVPPCTHELRQLRVSARAQQGLPSCLERSGLERS